MSTADTGPLLYALDRGYFSEAGFTEVELVQADSGREAADLLKAGDADIVYSTYVPLIVDGSENLDDVRLIAGASVAAPGSCMVVATPKSAVKSMRDLVGTRIAVTDKGTISASLITGTLLSHGIPADAVELVEMPFHTMTVALRSEEVDAAFLTEPYLSLVEEGLPGVVKVFDAADGELSQMPTAGYAASAEFVEANRNTVAAFRTIMSDAVREVRADWGRAAHLVAEEAHIPQTVALAASRLNLESEVEGDQIQRVADLLVRTGALGTRFDVRGLLLPWRQSHTANALRAGLPALVVAAGEGCWRRGRRRAR